MISVNYWTVTRLKDSCMLGLVSFNFLNILAIIGVP